MCWLQLSFWAHKAKGLFLDCGDPIKQCHPARPPRKSCWLVSMCCVLGRGWLSEPYSYSTPGCSVLGLSRQEYWSGLPCPPPGDLPDPGVEPASPALWADSLLLSHQRRHPWEGLSQWHSFNQTDIYWMPTTYRGKRFQVSYIHTTLAILKWTFT